MALDYQGKEGVATSIGHSPISALIDPVAGSRNSIAEALTNIIWAPLEKGLKSVSLSANSEIPSTALYNRASSPSLLHGHIQFAESETLFNPSSKGAQIILVKASAIEFRDPATGSINAEMGLCPMEVATT